MIKQRCKFDDNYNIIEFIEMNELGDILYQENRTYHNNNSLKSFHLKDEHIFFDPDFNVTRSTYSCIVNPHTFSTVNLKESELVLKALKNHIFSNHSYNPA